MCASGHRRRLLFLLIPRGAAMLAFDLETTGLDPARDRITCAAAYDPDTGIERVFFFPLGDDPEAFMRLLDDAERLCAFNGAEFDMAFIAAQLGASSERQRAWRLKLHDVYVACKWGLGTTFPLQALLEANGLQGKTGTGGDAVRLFREGRWTELGDYCLHDTRMTHRVSSLESIVIPKWEEGARMLPTGAFRVARAPSRD